MSYIMKARYIKVGWIPPGPEAPLLHGGVMIDLGSEVDAPTEKDMQEIAFAAKMAFAKIIRARKKASQTTRRQKKAGPCSVLPPGPSVPSIKVIGSTVEHGVEQYDDDTGQGFTYCGIKIMGLDLGPRDEPIDCEACRHKIAEQKK